MSWKTWNAGRDSQDVSSLSDKIFDLMHEVVFEMPDPGFDEWFDAGIEIDGETEILVFREMQETDWTDIDGTMRPGYTLTLQWPDGQQDTQAFFEDDGDDAWREYADYFAERAADSWDETR